MIAVDGEVWQVPASGHPIRVADTARVPFAVVTRLTRAARIAVPAGLDLIALGGLLDTRVVDFGMIQAVRIDGIFQELRVRSVKAQIPPYHPLVEVLSRDQMVFDLVNAQGTLVGFRFPACFSGINAPEWHFHFLSANLRAGGHVLGLVTGPGQATLDGEAKFAVEFLPPGANVGACSATQSCPPPHSP